MTLKAVYSLSHKTLVAGLLSLLFMPALSWAAEPLEGYRYRQQTGEKIEYFDWLLEKPGNLLLTVTSETETFLTVMNSDLHTQEWTVNNPAEEINIEARRRSDNVILNGRWHGHPFRKILHIDSAPWYQAMSLSMRAVMNAPETSLVFWTLRPDELKPLKLKAIKKGMEILQIGGRPVQAQKIEIRLTGLGSLLGHSLYWLRADDGLFLKYKGPNGLPGVTCTIITLERILLPPTDAGHMALCEGLNTSGLSADSEREHP